MTYGDLKFRLTQSFPGLSADLIEGWINDVYASLLGEIPWQRQDVETVLITAAPYSTGSVQVTNGSTSVGLVGGSWPESLNGRGFRVTGRSEFYELTFVGANSLILDRPFEGPTSAPPTLANNLSSGALTMTLSSAATITIGTSYLIDTEAVTATQIAGNVVTITRGALGTTAASHLAVAAVNPLASYSIFQHIYPLPDDCRLLADDAFGAMKRSTHGGLDQSDPHRVQTGKPGIWASYMDDSSVPPRMQVELYPVPNCAIGIPFTYAADNGPLTRTSTIIQVWMQPGALIEGVTSKIKAHLKDYTGAQYHAAAAMLERKNMRSSEAQGMAPAQMQLDSYYTAHRQRRCR